MSSYIDRDAIEVVVAAQWSRLLGAPPASLDADFFASGGSSLMAAQLTAALNKAFSTALPLQVVFDLRTFRAISAAIRQGVPAASQRLVTLTSEGSGVPLLLLPSGGGGVMRLHRFGGEPLNRPVYGLQTLGLDPEGVPCPHTLDDLIADFLQVVEASELPRRLHLAGYCSGGTFAYELARNLRSRGWDIASVSLLSTSLYSPPQGIAEIIQERLCALGDSVGMELKPTNLDAGSVFSQLKANNKDLVETDFGAFEARLQVYGALGAAVVGYVPETLDLPVRLFSTDDRNDPSDVSQTTYEVCDWPEIGLPDFQKYDLSVSHFEMLRHEPTLRTIEKTLSELDA
ncbi:thioesterase domain-containing protein [Streptomyces decoyicus]|uniref:thioesterase domain-containing protein n=1 Tax=Streptomyces decoyicus TaxID=249567 RepID=UPI00382CC731